MTSSHAERAAPGSRRTGRRRLYLMRHGHVDYFAEGLTDFTQVPLTEEGERQAKAAGEALRLVSFDAAFSSGLPRTQATLRHVLEANNHDAPPALGLPAFAELRGGSVTVETREELAARLAFSFDAAGEEGAAFLPGGEVFSDAYARVTEGLQALVREHDWKSALLVAHDGVNRLLLGFACGAGLQGCAHFEQDLACINVLDFDVVEAEDGTLELLRVVIKAVNLTAYDAVKETLPRTSLEHLFDIDFGGARPV
ncbi:histidine phosphatase family protein [Parvularcula oceani]|uniref:histidine phosphatase family protein n=1 Tax=Parvularcula oceani TaxID=1247963 RepID=UPI00055DB572|nr:histidine phosphatase family protein [Parvularcula oceani]